MKYVVVMIFILGTLILDSSFGYSLTSTWWTHLTYIFVHQNFIHLLMNSIGFLVLFDLLQKIFNKWTLLCAVFLIAFIASFFANYPLPTIGASGVVYALIGAMIDLVLAGKIKHKNRLNLFVFVFALLLSIMISFFKGTSNVLLHITCLWMGSVYGWAYNLFKAKT